MDELEKFIEIEKNKKSYFEYFLSTESNNFRKDKVLGILHLFIRQNFNVQLDGGLNFSIREIEDFTVIFPTVPSQENDYMINSTRIHRDLLNFEQDDLFIHSEDFDSKYTQECALVRKQYRGFIPRSFDVIGHYSSFSRMCIPVIRKGYLFEGSYQGANISLTIYKVYDIKQVNPKFDGNYRPSPNETSLDIESKNYVYDLSVWGNVSNEAKKQGIEMIIDLTEQHLDFIQYDITCFFTALPTYQFAEHDIGKNWTSVMWKDQTNYQKKQEVRSILTPEEILLYTA